MPLHLRMPTLLLFAALIACRGDDVPPVVAGDAAEEVAGVAPAEIPDRARALLDAGRPWRAALLMREYMTQVQAAPLEHRVLAARAEAGWGAWPEARALLDGVEGLEAHDGGLGLWVLGRALDEAGDDDGAIVAYQSFLDLPANASLERERAAARLRLGLARIRAGRADAARADLDASRRLAGDAAVWLELLEANALARAGDTAAVRAATLKHRDGVAGLRAWRARILAARQAGDPGRARALADSARAWARTNSTRAEFHVAAARAAIDAGDVASGRAALRAAIDVSPAGAHAREAAALLRAAEMSPADHLALARVLREQGLHEEAVDGFRAWLDADQSSAEERARVHMELATALFYANRFDDVPAALRPIRSRTPARMLLARAEAHRGNDDDAARIYLELAEELAGTATGAQALFLAAGARHDAGNVAVARRLYGDVLTRYPGTSQTGLAMMRLAGIAYADKDFREAARLWDAYRSRYPRGNSIVQATYWAGRAREQQGDTAGARPLYASVRERERDGYYGLRASQRLGLPFWPLPGGAGPADTPAAAARVRRWMEGLDLLRDAGFPDDASAEADRVVAAAGNDRPTLYALAEALAERGYAQRAIRIGFRLDNNGPADRRLLRILFPFPYRSLITDEAEARGLDPFVVAALIRQESMFEARITSPAGARGLMQVMPPTARALAEAAGIEDWDAELLYHPEINVHLGTRYVAQHMASYEGSLPSVFSAYNAGSHRVGWWSEYPEYADEELFTERIPFAETRGYVRILTRNLEVYRGLYGG